MVGFIKSSDFIAFIVWLIDQKDPESYWEALTEYDDGFELARNLWEEVSPLYMKLHEFVKARLFNFYDINDNSTEIPVYLLGT